MLNDTIRIPMNNHETETCDLPNKKEICYGSKNHKLL